MEVRIEFLSKKIKLFDCYFFVEDDFSEPPYTTDPNSSLVVGINRNQIVYTSVFDLIAETDFE